MNILTRYVLKEMQGPTLLGFGFYTFIILMKQLFDLAGMIIRRSLPVHTIGKLLLLSLPHIVVLTVPMSLLFGILIAIGRLSSDSEIIAMRALGISTSKIYLPVFYFSFAIFVLNLYLMNVVLPRGNTELQRLRAEVFTSAVEKEIQPRVFYDEYENLVIYINDINPGTAQWKGVFVADNRAEEANQVDATHIGQVGALAATAGPTGQKIIVADSGTLSIVPASKQVWLNLTRAQNHVFDPRKPDKYDQTRNNRQRVLLPDRFEQADPNLRLARSLRELNLPELIQQARLLSLSHADQVAYRLAKVEIHKKFAIPFACLAFGVVGLPLGLTNRRGGKSSGFSLSIAIILVYYVILYNGEALAASGKIGSAVGMWAPNVILMAFGIYLIIRANRDTGAQRGSGLFLTISGWLQQLMTRKSAEAVAHDASRRREQRSSFLSDLDIGFPNILDRYVLREFLKILALVVVSTLVLIMIIDYTEIASDIREHHISLAIVLSYYRFLFFQVLNWTLPISVLVSTLVTFGILSKNNEVTALKANGVSLYRVAVPVVGIAIAISFFSYFLLDFVLPYSNQRYEALHSLIKGKQPITSAPNQQKQWYLGKGRYIFNFLSYDRARKELSQVQVFEFDNADFRLTRRVWAKRARWDGYGWVFENGWIRSFDRSGEDSSYTPILNPIRLQYQERPEDFATEVKLPDQMTYHQLRRYITAVKRSGYAAEELSVKLYQKTSWPFIGVVMALIALPFAFRIGRRGALYGIGIALVLGIIYWMFFAVFSKFGEVGSLPPMLSAWSANILFAIAALYMFLHVDT
jgi:LPS export ABC transporter permease LptG/LPS export ABC transporter permease LptF